MCVFVCAIKFYTYFQKPLCCLYIYHRQNNRNEEVQTGGLSVITHLQYDLFFKITIGSLPGFVKIRKMKDVNG